MQAPRLRGQAVDRPFHVVLVEPEIPPNTGNVARICAATRCPLHLVGKLGFRIDEHAVRRAGLDYWHLVDVRQHPDLESAERDIGSRSWLFSARAKQSYLDVRFELGDALVFGKESVGLPGDLLDANVERTIRISIRPIARSLNVAHAVGIVVFEALRQFEAAGLPPADAG